jgi:hypothetical protein
VEREKLNHEFGIQAKIILSGVPDFDCGVRDVGSGARQGTQENHLGADIDILVSMDSLDRQRCEAL